MEVQRQELADLELEADFASLKGFGDVWRNDFSSLRNVLREANSLARVHALYKEEEARLGKQYPVVCCSRMDVLYFDKLPQACVQELMELDAGTVFVPDFHEWRLSSEGSISRSGGMNDRFAIGGPHAMRAYAAARVPSMHDFCTAKKLPLHTETFLQWHMKKAGANVKRLHFRFQRLRANGEVHSGDRELLPS